MYVCMDVCMYVWIRFCVYFPVYMYVLCISENPCTDTSVGRVSVRGISCFYLSMHIKSMCVRVCTRGRVCECSKKKSMYGYLC